MPLNFEIHKNGSLLSRHTAADETAKSKIVETIRFAQGHGILSSKDGITVVNCQEQKKELDPAKFGTVAAAPVGYQAPKRPKKAPQQIHAMNKGTSLASLFKEAGIIK